MLVASVLGFSCLRHRVVPMAWHEAFDALAAAQPNATAVDVSGVLTSARHERSCTGWAARGVRHVRKSRTPGRSLEEVSSSSPERTLDISEHLNFPSVLGIGEPARIEAIHESSEGL